MRGDRRVVAPDFLQKRLPGYRSLPGAVKVAEDRGFFSVKRTLLPLGLSNSLELGRNVYGPIVKIASSLVSYWRNGARTRANSTAKRKGLVT